MTEAYPLQWPHGYPRTPQHNRSRSKFSTTHKNYNSMLNELMAEVRRLGGHNMVLSTNIPIRKDGLPYAQQRRIDDAGVAVYFTRKGTAQCFACDRWESIVENMRAITKTIEALRGIERWGSGDMMERAFTGFTALAAPSAGRPWWEVLGFTRPSGMTLDELEARYRHLAKEAHPDAPNGSHDKMSELNRAIEEGRAAI